MSPNLSSSQHAQIQHMIENGAFTYPQISEAANCSVDAVKAISRNLRDFGSTRAPQTQGGRPPSITPTMRDALLEHLLRKPDLYLKEMVVYLSVGRIRGSRHEVLYQQDLTFCELVEEKSSRNSSRAKYGSTRFLSTQHFLSSLLPTRIRRRIWLR